MWHNYQSAVVEYSIEIKIQISGYHVIRKRTALRISMIKRQVNKRQTKYMYHGSSFFNLWEHSCQKISGF